MKKVIGIGNALVDVLVQLNDEAILSQYQLPKGGMQLIDFATAQQLCILCIVAFFAYFFKVLRGKRSFDLKYFDVLYLL